MQYRYPRKGIITSDDAGTSRKNLLNFGAVTHETMFLICVASCGYWAKIGQQCPFVALAYPTRWTIEMSLGAFKAATVRLYLI